MKTLSLIIMLVTSLLGCGGNSETISPENHTMSDRLYSVQASSIPIVQKIPVIVTIGDSETAGAVSTPTGFTNIPEASYPARLQGLRTNFRQMYEMVGVGMLSIGSHQFCLLQSNYLCWIPRVCCRFPKVQISRFYQLCPGY